MLFVQAFPAQAADIQSDGGRGDFLVIVGRPLDGKLLSSFNTSWNALGQPQFEVDPRLLRPCLLSLSIFLFRWSETHTTF